MTLSPNLNIVYSTSLLKKTVTFGEKKLSHTSYTLKKRITRRTNPIFHPVMILVEFGAVSVAPRSELCALVNVRVASPLAKPASTQSQ